MHTAIVFYPNKPGATFDFSYYVQRHFPMVLEKLKPFGAERFEIERGVANEEGGPPPYLAIGRLFLRDVAGFQRGMEAHGAEILADIPRYTNIEPTVQIAEVLS